MKKITLFLIATLFSAMSFAAVVPRVMAYGLKSELNTPEGFTKFTFSTNTKPTKAYLIFYYAGAEVMRVDITTQAQKKLKDATYTIRTSDLPELTNMKWAIEVQGDKINSLARVNDVNNVGTYGFNRPQGVAIDNNPESDFFGRMYIALPKAGGSSSTYGAYGDTKAGIVVFDAVHNRLASGITATGSVLGDETYGVHRVAVNPVDGKVYYTKTIASNTAVYELTPDATNVLSDEGTAKNVISGMSTITNANSLCFDKDGAMYVLGNAGYDGNTDTYTGKIYKVKNGTISEFTKEYYRWASKDNSIVSDNRGGFWVAQQRTNFDACDVLAHVNSNGERDYRITKTINNTLLPTKTNGTNVNASYRGQVAYYTIDNSNGILAFGGGGKVSVFKVTYNASGVPTLTTWQTISLISSSWNANVDGLAFDYAGNLVVMSATDERLGLYALPTDNNSCTTPAKSSLQVNGPATCRVMPHDLTLVDNGDSYTFSYKTNTYAQSGNLVIFKEDGKTVEKTFALPTLIVKNKTHQITIAKTDLPKRLGMNWGIELTGKAVPKYSYLQEVSDQTRQIYDFYNTQGVVVDNNPESDYFGKIYVQATLNGATNGSTDRAVAQKAGLFIYNQWLDELNPTSNVGIQPSLPSGYSIGSANQFNRLAIDPTTNNITYCYAVSGKPAVFSMDRANLTGTPTNLLAGQTGITRSVAHCFDADGNLYVMDLPGSGQILKIDKDGNKTKFGELTNKYVAVNMALASDGRGGLWVAQNRGQIDGYYQLVHYNKSGTVDYAVYQGSEHGFSGNSTRGALAYDAERQILAQGRNGSVILFDVTYDASTGVPTLTQQSLVASIGHNNIDGLAFDYAGDLYVVNSGKEKFYKFTIPTNNNTCLVPAKKSLTLDYPVNYLTYELNGGQYNEYGWESKGDICLALEADYNATYGSSKDWVQEVDGEIQYNINGTWMSEEEAKGQAATVTGFLQASTYNTTDNLKTLVETTMADKYGWLKDVIEANRTAQSVAGELSEAIYRKELSAFFLCSPAHSSWPASSSHEAMGDVAAFQSYWGQSFPNPSYTFEEIELHIPYKEHHTFDGWYNTSDFSGAELTTINENTTGTLYAKWVEHFYTRDVTDGEYGTICLPYASSNYTGAEFYEVSWLRLEGANPGLYLDEVAPGATLEAGKPYIFRGTSDKLIAYYEGDAVINPIEGEAGLTGTFTKIQDQNVSDPSNTLEGNYMISQNKLWLCGPACWLNPNRAYIKDSELPKTEQALKPGRRRVCMSATGENTATGTENAITPQVQVTKIIENGQVVIIRDGVKYNVQGIRIE